MNAVRQSGLRVFGLTLIASICLTGCLTGSVFAQTAPTQEPAKPTSEVEQLKQRLQQLEQIVSELKGQITAIEDAKAKTSAPAAIMDATYTTPATTAAEPPAPKQQDGKGESTFTIYGFAMLDAGYQFKQADPKWFDTVRPVKLPAFRDQFAPNGNTYFSVRQTRFGAKSTTPTKYGELKTIFEFELFGTGVDAGQTTFRLRHAWGELGQFGAGQYWSTFVDPDVFPNTNEYWGPNGIPWFRNVQFRWMPLKGKNSITIAAERPGASADLGQAADRIELQGVKPRFNLPDLTGNVRFDRNWGHVQIAGVVRHMKWVDTNNNDQFDLSGSATGAGISISSGLNFGKKDVGKFSYTYGHGIQNYMNDAPVDVGVVPNPGNARTPITGKALPMWAWMAYLDHTWNKRFSSSIGYSMLDISNSEGQAADAFRRGHYASGNFLFYPTERVMLGTEIIWGRRENFRDGFSSEDVHLQFSFKYNFSKVFAF